MADQIPGWARASIEGMNENPDRARALLARAGWPQIGETFTVEHAGTCSACGHPRIDVIEPSEGQAPLALVTSGCLVCDIFQVVDLDDVDLVEGESIPGSEGTADEENGGAH